MRVLVWPGLGPRVARQYDRRHAPDMLYIEPMRSYFGLQRRQFRHSVPAARVAPVGPTGWFMDGEARGPTVQRTRTVWHLYVRETAERARAQRHGGEIRQRSTCGRAGKATEVGGAGRVLRTGHSANVATFNQKRLRLE